MFKGPKSAHSEGGKVMAKRQREAALQRYLTDPKICQFCNRTILMRLGQKTSEVKVKKFCNHSCAAAFSNKSRRKTRFCKCGSILEGKRTLCPDCLPARKEAALLKTKAEVRRTTLHTHARRRCPAKSCESCGYSKFTEVCHIRKVEDFPDEATLEEINSPENMIRLCPNCHWELDRGMLDISRIRAG
jgi:uncharacterized protein YneF (UPF0154 family)